MSYPESFPEAVLDYIASGNKISEASAIFDVSESSIGRWRRRQKNTGSIKSKPRTNNPYKIDKEALKSYIKSYPDSYLNEIATHFNVTESGVKKVLKRLNITRKKKSKCYRERDEVKRIEYQKFIATYNPEKLIYIDESGIDSFISREYEWSIRGTKVMIEVSGKRFARDSFVAGLKGKEVIAPICY